MAEKRSPCLKCPRAPCPSSGKPPGCHKWRTWWIKKWDRQRKQMLPLFK